MQRIYERIITDKRYIEGVKYGKPRKGHQEGTVANHLIDLDKNLERIKPLVNELDYWKLKVLIHTHDTFKMWAQRDSAIDALNSHASLARKFLEEYTQDKDLLQMVQYHDENFALWKQLKRKGVYSPERLQKNILTIKDIDLFLIFTILDGYTPSKMSLATEEEPEKIYWFIKQVASYRSVGQVVYDSLKEFGL